MVAPRVGLPNADLAGERPGARGERVGRCNTVVDTDRLWPPCSRNGLVGKPMVGLDGPTVMIVDRSGTACVADSGRFCEIAIDGSGTGKDTATFCGGSTILTVLETAAGGAMGRLGAGRGRCDACVLVDAAKGFTRAAGGFTAVAVLFSPGCSDTGLLAFDVTGLATFGGSFAEVSVLSRVEDLEREELEDDTDAGRAVALAAEEDVGRVKELLDDEAIGREGPVRAALCAVRDGGPIPANRDPEYIASNWSRAVSDLASARCETFSCCADGGGSAEAGKFSGCCLSAGRWLILSRASKSRLTWGVTAEPARVVVGDAKDQVTWRDGVWDGNGMVSFGLSKEGRVTAASATSSCSPKSSLNKLSCRSCAGDASLTGDVHTGMTTGARPTGEFMSETKEVSEMSATAFAGVDNWARGEEKAMRGRSATASVSRFSRARVGRGAPNGESNGSGSQLT